MSRASEHAPHPHFRATSRESLALSIAREVRSRLPASGSMPGLDASIESSIRNQAIRNELSLSYVRAVAVAAVALVSLASWLQPALTAGVSLPGSIVGIFVLAAVSSIGLVVALRRGWYHRIIRLIVPAADALLIGLPALVFAATAPRDAPAAPGIVAVTAIACALLVFSGSVRLSRAAQRLATILATGTWLLAAIALGTPLLIALFAAGVLVAIGFLGTRLDSMVRAVVASEIADTSMRRLYDDARSAIEAREEVLHIVAHDLRNPLSTIGMTTSLLRDTPGEGRDDDKYFGIISRCTDSMNRIIQDLLEVARMEAGRLVIETAPVLVAELLEDVEQLMRPIAIRSDLRLECETVPPDLLIDADAARIQQVFSNLIGNAIKFTPAGGTITLRAQPVGDRVRFSVLDEGPGVPPERVERLFERFWQADTGDRRGIGLGLAIARSIVEAHDGRIGVESRPGGGSDFWFTAPLAARAAFGEPSSPERLRVETALSDAQSP